MLGLVLGLFEPGLGEDLHESIYDTGWDHNTAKPNVNRGEFGGGGCLFVQAVVKKSENPLTDHGYHDNDTDDLMSGLEPFCLQLMLEDG